MRQGAGTTVLCQSALRFSQLYLSKAVFMYIVRSPHFIPSPCVILSPESAFFTLSVFYTQSAVHGAQSMFYTDRNHNHLFHCKFLSQFQIL